MRTININTNTIYQHTPISNIFIDDFLPQSKNPMYSVIYIYFYRHCYLSACSITTADVAETFGILETDVVNCLRYWEKMGLIRLAGDDEESNIEFIPPEAAAINPPTAVLPVSVKTAEQPSKPPVSAVKPVTVVTRPNYTVEEIEIYKKDSPEVAQLFSLMENVFGTLLQHNDICVIYGIYDWLRLPLDVIKLLLADCARREKLNRKYIEQVAIDWVHRGLTTVEAVEKHLSRCDKDYREIMDGLGKRGHTAAKSERRYMDKWLEEYALPLEIILEACDQTTINRTSRRFFHCDEALTDLHNKGTKSLEDAKREIAEFFSAPFSKNAKSSTNTGKIAPAAKKPTRFANFTQREIDFKEIERIERAHLALPREKRVKL